MMNIKNNTIVIGGVGGSGTRVVAEVCQHLGLFIGNNLNNSNDNLSYPDLRSILLLSDEPETIRQGKAYQSIEAFIDELTTEFKQTQNASAWGWKVPGSFYFLDYFKNQIPKLKYIHVIRNGFDMAFSPNQNQLKNWGPLIGVTVKDNNQQKASLEYWYQANQMAIDSGQKVLQKHFHLLDFDHLCLHPLKELDKLLRFLSINPTEQLLSKLSDFIKPPSSLNRHLKYDYKNIFSNQQFKKINQLNKTINEIRAHR